jgi:hypothetical protein
VPEARVVAPLLIFFVMGAVILWLLWRVVVAGGRARHENASAVAAAEIARRSETLLGDLLVVVDEMRRRQIAPEVARPKMADAHNALGRNIADATLLSGGGPWANTSAALVADLERAQRAIELVAHGGELLADVSGVGWGEGETSVKRGYLNLVHAREAIRSRRETIVMAAQAGPVGRGR